MRPPTTGRPLSCSGTPSNEPTKTFSQENRGGCRAVSGRGKPRPRRLLLAPAEDGFLVKDRVVDDGAPLQRVDDVNLAVARLNGVRVGEVPRPLGQVAAVRVAPVAVRGHRHR